MAFPTSVHNARPSLSQKELRRRVASVCRVAELRYLPYWIGCDWRQNTRGRQTRIRTSASGLLRHIGTTTREQEKVASHLPTARPAHLSSSSHLVSRLTVIPKHELRDTEPRRVHRGHAM